MIWKSKFDSELPHGVNARTTMFLWTSKLSEYFEAIFIAFLHLANIRNKHTRIAHLETKRSSKP